MHLYRNMYLRAYTHTRTQHEHAYSHTQNASCRFTTCDIHLDDLVLKGPIFKNSFEAEEMTQVQSAGCIGTHMLWNTCEGQRTTSNCCFFYSGPRYEFGLRHLYPLSSLDAS